MRTKILSLALFLLLLTAFFGCEPVAEQRTLDGGMTVSFIDVGQADCALLVCDGQTMLIDGGNSGDSDLIYSYLHERNVKRLDYIIATHPHEDHVGGIPGALACVTEVGTAFSPVTEYENYYFTRMADRLAEMGVPLTVPKAGDGFDLGEARVTFLGPVELVDDMNQNSLVCKVEYGEISFLFTGDAERPAEKAMLASGADLSATVLKVGHHGSAMSSCYEFLREVQPAYAVISCERNNQYGHPDDGLLSRLRDAGVTVCRTDRDGDIVFTTDGTTLAVSVEKGGAGGEAAASGVNPDGGDEAGQEPQPMYIGNVSSKKYHLPNCTGLPLEKNRVYFYSLEEAVGSGFTPCGLCKP